MTPRRPEAVLAHLLAHLPPGWAWPREADSVLARTLSPLARGLSRLEEDAARLQAEAPGPRNAALLLDGFEAVLGGDPCAVDIASLSLADRQALAHMRWIARGGQSPGYFVALAAALGTPIAITEQRVTQCGLAECGEELTPEGEQFRWIVTLAPTRLIDAECGAAECGDALGDLVPNIVECAIRTARPAHTEVFFSYA